METYKKHYRLTFLESVLGSASGDPNIHEEFIASKAPDAPTREEEVEAIGVDGVIEKSKTVFARGEDGEPIMWDYQVRGFFKAACGALRQVKGTKSEKIKAYKKKVDQLVFVNPRKIKINFEGEIGSCQRSLRGQTAQGERTALANSEEIPAGAYIDIEVECLNESDLATVEEWLEYGRFNGLGQWRNSGHGKFSWEEI